jgi:hypothetical protein
MSVSKKALIFEGPGFSDQGDLVENLKARRFEVEKVFVSSALLGREIHSLESADFVLLRGSWTAAPEDMAMAQLLGLRLRHAFMKVKSSGGFKKHQKVVAVGRGALALWATGFYDSLALHQVPWKEALTEDGPFLQCHLPQTQGRLLGLVQGRALPIPVLPKLDVWLTRGMDVLGWSKGSVYMTLVDIFAYSDRTQLDDFGYTDLLSFPVQGHVLDALLSGDLAGHSP